MRAYQNFTSWMSVFSGGEDRPNSTILKPVPPVLPSCQYDEVAKWFDEYKRYVQLMAAKGPNQSPIPMARCISVEAQNYIVGRYGLNSGTDLTDAQKWEFVSHVYEHNGVAQETVDPADTFRGVFMVEPRHINQAEKNIHNFVPTQTCPTFERSMLN